MHHGDISPTIAKGLLALRRRIADAGSCYRLDVPDCQATDPLPP
jgi:hypothetical protein